MQATTANALLCISLYYQRQRQRIGFAAAASVRFLTDTFVIEIRNSCKIGQQRVDKSTTIVI